MSKSNKEIIFPIPEKCAVEEELKRMFPHGHQGYIPMAMEEMELHSKKNYDYASGGDAFGNFKRVAAILSNYPGISPANPKYTAAVALIYALKQLDQVLWSLSRGWSGEVEGLAPRLADISVYAKIASLILAEEEEVKL